MGLVNSIDADDIQDDKPSLLPPNPSKNSHIVPKRTPPLTPTRYCPDPQVPPLERRLIFTPPPNLRHQPRLALPIFYVHQLAQVGASRHDYRSRLWKLAKRLVFTADVEVLWNEVLHAAGEEICRTGDVEVCGEWAGGGAGLYE
jgi:hypothetical protein